MEKMKISVKAKPNSKQEKIEQIAEGQSVVSADVSFSRLTRL
jgi:uncharacterized protein YggU (UPF0235/DUF167 family)